MWLLDGSCRKLAQALHALGRQFGYEEDPHVDKGTNVTQTYEEDWIKTGIGLEG